MVNAKDNAQSGPTRASARDVAFARLDRERLPGLKAGELRHGARLAETELEGRDAGLAEALYVSVVKGLLPLRHRVEYHAGKPWKAIDPLVQKVLLLGAVQLTAMDRVPAAVAVDQAVEQCRRFGRPRAAAMVNAVLRNFGRQDPPAVDPADPELAYSMPREVWQKLVGLLGADKAAAFCKHANTEPTLTLRLMPGVKLTDLPTEIGGEDGVTLEEHTQAGMIVAKGARRALISKWAEAGLAQPQDPTAALVADATDVGPGMTVLDRCAGVGTKGVQMAARVLPGGSVHAMDVDGRRCSILARFAKRRKLDHIHVYQAGKVADAEGLPAEFDRVVADVPCSNSGVMARRPEARYHQTPKDLASLEKLQAEILADSASRVKVGGLLIYSTCSIWPEENAERVKRFLKSDTRFVLRAERATFPGGEGPTYRDGGFIAIMVRDRA